MQGMIAGCVLGREGMMFGRWARLVDLFLGAPGGEWEWGWMK